MISFACPRCTQGYRVPDDRAGKRTRCAKCGEPLVVPATPAGSAAPPTAPPPRTSDRDTARDRVTVLGASAGAPGPLPVTPREAEVKQLPGRPEPLPARLLLGPALACGSVVVVLLVGLVALSRSSSPATRPTPAPSLPPVRAEEPPSQLTRDNFLAVREGMGQSEVTLLLGEPTSRKAWPDLPEDSMRLTWKEGPKHIVVSFHWNERGGFRVTGKWQKGLN